MSDWMEQGIAATNKADDEHMREKHGVVFCTWMLYPDDADGEEPYECGNKAVMQFVRRNNKRGPDQPKWLRYPRCKRHFTDRAEAYAGMMGYDMEKLP